MGKLFDIVKNKVQLSPDVLAVPAFNAIWERDTSRQKSTANKELAYVIFLCDFKSPYKDTDYTEKESLVRKDVFGKRSTWKPDDIVLYAVEKYHDLQKTRTMRLLDSSRKAVEKLAQYFDTINFEERDVMGKPIYSARDVSSNLKEVGNIVKSLTTLEKQVQSEITELSVRGGGKINYYEDTENLKSIKAR